MYDREASLRIAFNHSVANLLGIEEKDYYSNLTTDQMLSLKTTLSDINNIITLRLVFSLADWICDKMRVPNEEKKNILNKIQSSKPNANGYDIELSVPDTVAEIKCNIPIKAGRKFGSAQRNGLRKDIEGLLAGKSKSSKNTTKSIKILGMYDKQEVRAATEHFVKNLPAELNQKVIIEPLQGQALDNQHIYVVFVK